MRDVKHKNSFILNKSNYHLLPFQPFLLPDKMTTDTVNIQLVPIHTPTDVVNFLDEEKKLLQELQIIKKSRTKKDIHKLTDMYHTLALLYHNKLYNPKKAAECFILALEEMKSLLTFCPQKYNQINHILLLSAFADFLNDNKKHEKSAKTYFKAIKLCNDYKFKLEHAKDENIPQMEEEIQCFSYVFHRYAILLSDFYNCKTESLTFYESALDCDPNNIKILHMYTQLLYDQKNIHQCFPFFRKLLKFSELDLNSDSNSDICEFRNDFLYMFDMLLMLKEKRMLDFAQLPKAHIFRKIPVLNLLQNETSSSSIIEHASNLQLQLSLIECIFAWHDSCLNTYEYHHKYYECMQTYVELLHEQKLYKKSEPFVEQLLAEDGMNKDYQLLHYCILKNKKHAKFCSRFFVFLIG